MPYYRKEIHNCFRNPIHAFLTLFTLVAFSATPAAQNDDDSFSGKASTSQEKIIPLVATGIIEGQQHFTTTFTFLNLTNTTFEGRLNVYDQQGNEIRDQAFCPNDIAGQVNTSLQLQPGALRHWSTNGDTGFLSGWAKVTTEDASQGTNDLLASASIAHVEAEPEPCPVGPICNRPSYEIRTSVEMLAIHPARDFRTPVMITENRNTALSIINPSETKRATVTLRLIDDSGEPFLIDGSPVQRTGELATLKQASGFIWELLFNCHPLAEVCIPVPPTAQPERFHGSLEISSDLPIAVGVLQVLFPEGKYVEVPVQSLVSQE